MLSHGAYTYQRALRTPEHLYVKTLHPGCWRLDREQLYAITDDPHMTTDLMHDHEKLAVELGGILNEWRVRRATLSGPVPDPMEAARYEGPADTFAVGRYLNRLRDTGRAHLADDLERRRSQDWVTARRW